jgi:hypothetical protein
MELPFYLAGSIEFQSGWFSQVVGGLQYTMIPLQVRLAGVVNLHGPLQWLLSS